MSIVILWDIDGFAHRALWFKYMDASDFIFAKEPQPFRIRYSINTLKVWWQYGLLAGLWVNYLGELQSCSAATLGGRGQVWETKNVVIPRKFEFEMQIYN